MMAAVVRFNNHSEFYNCCSIYIKDNIQRSCEEKPQYCCGPSPDHKFGYALKARSAARISEEEREVDN